MYDTKMLCTYNLIDDEEGSETLYRIQLLQAFGVDNVDKITDSVMDDLYDKVSGNEWFIQQCKRVFVDTFGHDLDNGAKLGFTMMFHYGLFWITHKCICKIINNGAIDNDTILLLENTIVNK